MGDAGTVEPKTRHVRPTSGRHQDRLGVRLVSSIRRHGDAVGLLPHGNRATSEPLDAFAFEDAPKNASRVWIVVRQRAETRES